MRINTGHFNIFCIYCLLFVQGSIIQGCSSEQKTNAPQAIVDYFGGLDIGRNIKIIDDYCAEKRVYYGDNIIDCRVNHRFEWLFRIEYNPWTDSIVRITASIEHILTDSQTIQLFYELGEKFIVVLNKNPIHYIYYDYLSDYEIYLWHFGNTNFEIIKDDYKGKVDIKLYLYFAEYDIPYFAKRPTLFMITDKDDTLKVEDDKIRKSNIERFGDPMF